MSDRQAHMAFLQENLETILSRSADLYQQCGRGLWVFKDNGEGADGSTGVYIDDLSKLPEGDLNERLRGMVAAYDPDTQAVVLLAENDGSEHAYTVGQRSQDMARWGGGKSHERPAQ
jgi:hypothetical protein